MLKSAILLPALCATTLHAAAQKLPADTVKGLIRDLSRELALKHPGFYRYHTPAYFARYTDSLAATVTDSLTELETFRKLKPFIAQVGCLHTELQLSEATRAEMAKRPILSPCSSTSKAARPTCCATFPATTPLHPAVKY